MPAVYVVSSALAMEYLKMFHDEGWEIVDNIAEADMLQFTGGEDVSPELYGHAKHRYTCNSPARDRREQMIFQMALKAGKPMAGICRGGQFLNVMCGGQMWQDIDGHATNAGHSVKDERTGEMFMATSTHHQMMVPAKTGVEVVCTARVSTWGEKCIEENKTIHVNTGKMQDIEALYYAAQKVFCFQPHPEFAGRVALQRHYFGYLHEFFDLASNKHFSHLAALNTGKPIVRVVPGL